MQQQPTLFNIPEIQPASNRRRTRRLVVIDGTITSRKDRIGKRNHVMVARYYYWTELRRRRFDDTLKILSDNEFFVEERTISNALTDLDDYYNHLINEQASRAKLRKQYPGFDWD